MYRYLLVDTEFQKRSLVRLIDGPGYSANVRHLAMHSMGLREINKPPSLRTLQVWKKNGKARALCGCWVNGLDRCPIHDKMSWLTAMIGLTNKKSFFNCPEIKHVLHGPLDGKPRLAAHGRNGKGIFRTWAEVDDARLPSNAAGTSN